MAALCAACLLAAGLASAPDAAPAVVPAPTRDTTTPADETPAPPPPSRLALRDPFKLPVRAVDARAQHSPDLIDPFTRPPATTPAPTRDLMDPFVEGAPRRCLPTLRGVPLQRPRQLPQTSVPCTVESPLVNPFTPRTPAPTG